MKELRQIRDAVIGALRDAGLEAEAAFPAKWAAERETALATVAVGAAEGKALGLCGYLGQTRGAGGEIREVYGKRLEGRITVDLRAARAADCEDGAETAGRWLMGTSPGSAGLGEGDGAVPAAGRAPVRGAVPGRGRGGGRRVPGFSVERGFAK